MTITHFGVLNNSIKLTVRGSDYMSNRLDQGPNHKIRKVTVNTIS